MNKNENWIVLTLFLIALFLGGCRMGSTSGYYLGASAAEMEFSALDGQFEGDQVWEDLYLQVTYRLQREGNVLKIDGELEFSDSSRTNYDRVSDLKLNLYLLDSRQRVVSYREVARTLSYSLEEVTSFSSILPMDDSVVAWLLVMMVILTAVVLMMSAAMRSGRFPS